MPRRLPVLLRLGGDMATPPGETRRTRRAVVILAERPEHGGLWPGGRPGNCRGATRSRVQACRFSAHEPDPVLASIADDAAIAFDYLYVYEPFSQCFLYFFRRV